MTKVSTAMREAQVALLFRCGGTYRTWSTFAWAFVFNAGAALLAIEATGMLLHGILAPDGALRAGGGLIVIWLAFVAFCGGLSSAFFWVGLRLSRAYRNATSLEVRITNDGVAIGPSYYHWSTVPWIGGKRVLPFVNRFVLCIGDREVSNVSYALPTDRWLRRSEFEELMEKIRSHLEEEFPHIQVGRIAPMGAKLYEPRLP